MTLQFRSQTSSLQLRSLCKDFLTSSWTRGTQTSTQPVGSTTTESDDSKEGIMAVYVVATLVAIVISVAIGWFTWRRRNLNTGERSVPPAYVNSVCQAGTDMAHTNDEDQNHYESLKSLEHHYSSLDHVSEHYIGTRTNVDHTYEYQPHPPEDEYESIH